MRSSSGRALALSLLVASVLGIAWLRPRLAERFHRLRVTSDVYALPSPEQTVVASLGYRSALADLLYAHVLVSYGLHFQEGRRFETAGSYLDTINALDPKFRAPYRFADTILTLQARKARPEDVRKARQIIERGLRERPYDTELWSAAGQYLAYLAPAYLSDPKEKREWKLAGARTLARACELVSDNENIPYHCITAAGILTRQGHRQATIQFLKRVLAVTDDPEIKRLALGYLGSAVSEQEREQAEQRLARFRERWGKDLTFLSKDRLLVIGPGFDAARCAGRLGAERPECATTWRAWAERIDEER